MIRVIEGPIKYLNDPTYSMDFTYIQNCVWSVVVTMTTVGYGDYYPMTNLGRFILLSSCFYGIIIMSFMVVALQNFLKLGENEANALDEQEKIQLNHHIQIVAGQYFLNNYKYILHKRYYQNCLQFNDSNTNIALAQAKDALYAKIESRKHFKRLFHKFRYIFEQYTDYEWVKSRIDNIKESFNSRIKLTPGQDIIEDISTKTKVIKEKISEYIQNEEKRRLIRNLESENNNSSNNNNEEEENQVTTSNNNNEEEENQVTTSNNNNSNLEESK